MSAHKNNKVIARFSGFKERGKEKAKGRRLRLALELSFFAVPSDLVASEIMILQACALNLLLWSYEFGFPVCVSGLPVTSDAGSLGEPKQLAQAFTALR